MYDHCVMIVYKRNDANDEDSIGKGTTNSGKSVVMVTVYVTQPHQKEERGHRHAHILVIICLATCV